MILFEKVADLQEYLSSYYTSDATIGFVPTMGALHEGHLSLTKRAVAENDISVCSIFVNPTQFDDKADLLRYPRTLAEDMDMLRGVGNRLIFSPTVDEMYPPDLDTSSGVDFGEMATHMEGAHRPGHFDGVAQVVKRLVDIVQPDRMYMGQKDYQQQALMRYMMRVLDYNTEVVTCPIIREADGLAMSSRNRHLTPKERQSAGQINKVLAKLKENARRLPLAEAHAQAWQDLSDIPGAKPDYLEIVDGFSLKKLNNFEEAEMVVACTTVRIGKVRLLDNIVITNE